MNPNVLAALVHDIGIPAIAGRTSAIRQHVLGMPAPVVADAFSYHPKTTALLAAQPGRRQLQPLRPRRPQAPVTRAEPGRRRDLITSPLPAALRVSAEGICTLEAATGLIIAHATWLARDDFARFLHHGAGTAAIDWEAAIGALAAGSLPGSAGEKRMLRLAASLARQATIGVGEAVTGIDDRNFALLVKSVWHASGRRQFG